MWTVVVAALTLFQTGAPKDVPSGHWAHAAVSELFRAGILHGYKSDPQPLQLKVVPPDGDWILRVVSGWKSDGLLVGYPDGHSRRPPSEYEQAVAIHAVWANACGLLKEPKTPKMERLRVVAEFENLARAVCMRSPELTKLGADTKAMIADLERLRCNEFGWVTFRG